MNEGRLSRYYQVEGNSHISPDPNQAIANAIAGITPGNEPDTLTFITLEPVQPDPTALNPLEQVPEVLGEHYGHPEDPSP